MEELIKKLKTNPDFIEFTDYILQVIDGLDTVSGVDSMTNEQAGEEVKVRSKAKARLYEILKPFIEFQEKKEPTEAEIKKTSGRYGL